jgi:streptogramin lyase
MAFITRSLVSAALPGLLALGACSSNDNLDSGMTMQPGGGQDAGQAGSSFGGQAGTGGQPLGGSDGSMSLPVTVQQDPPTATGTVTYFNLSLDLAGNLGQTTAVAIAPDGAPWFTAAAGLLVRLAPDETAHGWPEPAPGGFSLSLVSDGTVLWGGLWGPPGSISRFDPVTHSAATYPVPDALARPAAAASDGHGGVWVSGGNEPIVGRVDATNGVVVVAAENAPAPITLSTAGLAVASDGVIFVSDYDQGRIGRVVGSAFAWTDLGGTANAPSGLAAGDDGSVWFVSLGSPNEVGRVAHDGTLQAYPLPAPSGLISDKSASTIARAPDGSFWFALPERQQLGQVTADGQMSFLNLTTTGDPIALAFDPSGRLWFTTDSGFGRVDFSTSP